MTLRAILHVMEWREFGDHMDKFEAAEHLGVSVRTISRMVSQGEIAVTKIRGNRGAETLDFDPAELDRVRELREKPEHVGAIAKYEPHPLATILNDPHLSVLLSKLMGAVDAINDMARRQVAQTEAPDLTAIDKKMFLTFDEAAALSGLGKSFLRSAIEDGQLATIPGAGPHGSTVIRRADLDKFAQALGSRASSRSKGPRRMARFCV